MNYKYIPFNERLNALVKDTTKVANVAVTSVAIAISNRQPMPSSSVENPTSYFNMQIAPAILELISKWNENVVMDAHECLEQVRLFWLLRYSAAYPGEHILYSPSHAFFDTLFGVPNIFPPQLHEFVDGEDVKQPILTLAMLAADIMTEISTTDQTASV